MAKHVTFPGSVKIFSTEVCWKPMQIYLSFSLVMPVEGMRLWQSWETRDHWEVWMTLLIVSLYLSGVMIIVDSDLGTWSMLCVTGLVISDAPGHRCAPFLLWRGRSYFVIKFLGLLKVVCGVTWHYIAVGWTLEIPCCFCSSVLHKKAKLNASNDTGWILCLLDAIYVALPEPLTTTDLFNTLKYFV